MSETQARRDLSGQLCVKFALRLGVFACSSGEVFSLQGVSGQALTPEKLRGASLQARVWKVLPSNLTEDIC